ncbi:hypothetical protein [Asticcacaulis excentricus]|uniref:Tetratricopeptide repeat protein n=1 Tax=Asticcacaulis excentricus (strain ATCC 15261 / DSM 4724 / KCTC 12464 / NCIMB 9791 / VKM B-1370 / CB 48) TaxID=573065 RepID=E8RPT1_ASTEC|nr:hypothetical protein [Asticcacaulis excentricus]ADU12058.1 hypothetical protein Astex_0362 [Asticcacaulis excentricus CB 48]
MRQFLLLSAFVGATALIPVSAKALDIAAPASDQSQYLQKLLSQAGAHIQSEDFYKAIKSLRTLIDNPQFGSLPSDTQVSCYRLLSIALLNSDKPEEAYDALERARRVPGDATNYEYWRLRLAIAPRLKKHQDAVEALTVLASRFPRRIQEIDRNIVYSIVNLSNEIQDRRASKRRLLEALLSAPYTPQETGYSVESLSFELFEIYTSEGDINKAATIAAAFVEPESLIKLRIDKRYIGYRQMTEAQIAAAYEAQLARHRDFANRNPTLLAGPELVAYDLNQLDRSEEALKVIDEALSKHDRAPVNRKPYDDLATRLNWTLDTKSRILWELERYAEAERVLRMARDVAVANGRDMVSQKINLAGLYTSLSRPNEALKEVGNVKVHQANLYGLMSMEGVKVCAYAQTGETDKMKASLAVMLQNAKAAYPPLQSALLCAEDSDTLAKVIIDKLEDPDTRTYALMDVQNYLQRKWSTPEPLARQDIWKKTLNRADVQASILKYGEIISLPIRPFYF